MADEPENLVLQILREIRSKQDQDSHRLGEVEKQLKSLNTKITYLMGLSTDADFKAQTAINTSDELNVKIGQLIARLEALEAH